MWFGGERRGPSTPPPAMRLREAPLRMTSLKGCGVGGCGEGRKANAGILPLRQAQGQEDGGRGWEVAEVERLINEVEIYIRKMSLYI